MLYGLYTRTAFGESWQFERALSALAVCTEESRAVACSREPVQRILSLSSASEVMDSLEQKLTAAQCHYIGHVVGQQAYIREQDAEVAFSTCNRACDSACIHGAIGEAFAEELGYDPDLDTAIDLQHLDTDGMAAVGKRLCVSTSTCHGVGHTAYQLFNGIEPALALCREISTEDFYFYCANGVFMEYADILSAQNMRTVSGVTFPHDEELAGFCVRESADEMRACFRYFPRIVRETYAHTDRSPESARRRIRDTCIEMEDVRVRAACVAGIGASAAYLVKENQGEAIQVCEQFRTRADSAACYLGQVSVATLDRSDVLVRYCGIVPEPAMRASCYRSFSNLFASAGGSPESIVALCEPENELCREGVTQSREDAWFYVEKTYEDLQENERSSI